MKKVANPPNPFLSAHRELLEPASDAKVEIYEDASRTLLSKNESPDLSFGWSVNPYRGCFHSCAYCYARRYHEYLDLGAGTDFETKLFVKSEAPQLLRQAFMKKSWEGELVMFSGATDCYQPIEAVYKLTQQCLKVCLEFRNPAAFITKSFLITRDVELLAELHRQAFCTVAISIPFASDEMARKMEPQAATIERRFAALKALAKAGIPVGVSLAPTIPGLNENDMPGILKRIRETRDGKMNDTRFGHRSQGEGVYWKSIADVFRLYQQKYGLVDYPEPPTPSPFRRLSAQMELW